MLSACGHAESTPFSSPKNFGEPRSSAQTSEEDILWPKQLMWIATRCSSDDELYAVCQTEFFSGTDVRGSLWYYPGVHCCEKRVALITSVWVSNQWPRWWTMAQCYDLSVCLFAWRFCGYAITDVGHKQLINSDAKHKQPNNSEEDTNS